MTDSILHSVALDQTCFRLPEEPESESTQKMYMNDVVVVAEAMRLVGSPVTIGTTGKAVGRGCWGGTKKTMQQ